MCERDSLGCLDEQRRDPARRETIEVLLDTFPEARPDAAPAERAPHGDARVCRVGVGEPLQRRLSRGRRRHRRRSRPRRRAARAAGSPPPGATSSRPSPSLAGNTSWISSTTPSASRSRSIGTDHAANVTCPSMRLSRPSRTRPSTSVVVPVPLPREPPPQLALGRDDRGTHACEEQLAERVMDDLHRLPRRPPRRPDPSARARSSERAPCPSSPARSARRSRRSARAASASPSAPSA